MVGGWWVWNVCEMRTRFFRLYTSTRSPEFGLTDRAPGYFLPGSHWGPERIEPNMTVIPEPDPKPTQPPIIPQPEPEPIVPDPEPAPPLGPDPTQPPVLPDPQAH
jgi:hypothetical protein